MTNEGVVTKLLPNGMAEVAVTRATACGGSCGSCEGCTEGHCTFRDADIEELIRPAVTVPDWAREEADIAPDAKLLVYIMPLVFFIGGYALAYALGALEGVRIAVSFAFLAVSAVVLVITQRSKKREPINFNIIEICEDGQND